MIKKAFWDITYKCNGKCVYCFTDSDSSRDEGMDLEKKKKVVDILLRKGIKKFSFGGGEPFLIADFIPLCEYIGDRGGISLTTNGSILNEKILNFLMTGKINITVSLDTMNKEKFASVRQGLNFEQIINNIERLVLYDKIREKLSIRCTVTNDTLDEVESVLKFCLEHNIPKMKVNTTNDFGRAKEERALIPRFEDFQKKLGEINDISKEFSSKIVVELPISKYLGPQKEICTLGKQSIYIDPEGNIFPCAFSEGAHNMGNILKDENVWLNLEQFTYDNECCRKCPIHRYEDSMEK